MIDKLSLSARAERRAMGYRPGRYRMPSRPRRTGSPALWYAIAAARHAAERDLCSMDVTA